MSEYDSKNTTKGEVALSPQDIGVTITTTGEDIDTLDFDSLTYHVQSGALAAGGVFAFELEEADPLPGVSPAAPAVYAAVLADNIIGSLTGFVADTAADVDATKRVGSIGKKRFQRIKIVATTPGAANFFSALAVLGHAKTNPTVD